MNGRRARQTCTLKHLLRNGQAVPSRFRGVPHQWNVKNAKGSALILHVRHLAEGLSTVLDLSVHPDVVLSLRLCSFDANTATLEAAVASAAAAAAATRVVVRQRVAKNDDCRGVAAVGGAAELVTLPQYAPTRHPLAVCDLGLAFASFVVALVLVSVGTDGVVHVQRAVARHSAANDILLRLVASGRHGLDSELVRREGADLRSDALELLLQRAW